MTFKDKKAVRRFFKLNKWLTEHIHMQVGKKDVVRKKGKYHFSLPFSMSQGNKHENTHHKHTNHCKKFKFILTSQPFYTV